MVTYADLYIHLNSVAAQCFSLINRNSTSGDFFLFPFHTCQSKSLEEFTFLYGEKIVSKEKNEIKSEL